MRKRLPFVAVALVILAFTFTSCAGSKELTKKNERLTSDLSQARAQISDLEDQLMAKDQEIEDLAMQVRSKEEELTDLQEMLATTQEEAQDLEIQVVSKEEEIASLQYALDAGSIDTKDQVVLLSEKKALEKKTVMLRGQLDSANEEISQLNTRIDDMTAELASLQQARSRDRTRMDMTYDELVASLEQEIEEKTIEIQRYENALTINIMDQIFFDSGKAVIKKDGYSVLDRIGGVVKNLPGKVIRVEGHTDDVPIGMKIRSKYPSNWELGAARASAVARYFIDEQGIEPERLVAISYSKYKPIVPNISDEYRAKNRRIEIVLTDQSLYELMKVAEGVQ